MLVPQTTVGYAFLKYFCTFVVYVVCEYATIVGINNEILDICPDGKIFNTVKLKPFFSWFIYDYDYRQGLPLLTVCIQFLVLPVVCIWLIGLSWFTIKCVGGVFWNVVGIWKKIDTTVFITMVVALIITNITRYTVLIYCACKKYPNARDYCWGTKFDWAGEFKYIRERKKKDKELEWQCALRHELKMNCQKKYKGQICVYQNDLDKLEKMVFEKYPEAKMERTYDDKKKYIWRVYYEEKTLFEVPIRKK
jgi:hypothetical protein